MKNTLKTMGLIVAPRPLGHVQRLILLTLIILGVDLGKGWASVSANNEDSLKVALEEQQAVTGKVTDENGAAIPGASVLIVGTSRGTTTDFDGIYSIEANNGDEIQFSYLGFATKTITVGASNTINITLEETTSSLDEVVVIGYGSRKKKDITGAISTLNAEEITREVKATPELAIQGKLPGVFVSNPGSNPNARPEIRIRGVSTLGFNDPLFVIDGVPVTEGGINGDGRASDLRGNVNVLNLINPNDIESISVLKDASAAAIYGVRASNGVILIETKRGREGKATINFSSTVGVQTLSKRFDVLNTQQYVDIYNEAWANNAEEGREDDEFGAFYDPTSPDYLGNNPTYNWFDQATRTATIQDYNISMSGGNQVSNYALGVGYSNQEDPNFAADIERYSFNINSDHNLKNWFKVGQSLRIVTTISNNENGPGYIGSQLVSPWQPLFDPNGLNGFANTVNTLDGSPESRGYGNSTRDNFLGQAPYFWDRTNLFRTLGSVYAEIRPFKNFRVRGTYSVDYYTNRNDRFSLPEIGFFDDSEGALRGSGTEYRLRNTGNLNLVGELLFGYANSFGKHNLDLIANLTDQKYYYETQQQGGQNLGITAFDQRQFLEGQEVVSFYERDRTGLLGYMGRLSYNYDSKYYLDVTVRRDGSSRFGPGFKWGTFPSANVAWRVSSERFMEGTDWINDLKIRAGWGEIGNQETQPFNFLALVNNNPVYPTAGGLNQGAFLNNFPVLDATWETVTTQSLGFDAILFNNKINLTAEYYHRETEGILQQIEIPTIIGARENPVVNLANITNSGVEINLGYNDKFGEVGFNASANLTTTRNRVSNLYLGLPQGGQNRIENGFPLGYLFGYETDGIFQTQGEVDTWLANNESPGFDSQLAPGDFRFKDNFTTPESGDFNDRTEGADGRIDIYDQTYLGKTIPGFFYGFNLGADYKGIDLSLFFRGVGDVQRVNSARRDGENMANGGSNYFTTVLDRWTPSNPSNTFPRAVSGDPSGNNRFSDRWVEDADFLRLQNVQLGYTFDSDILESIKFGNLRVFASLSNVFVLTPFSGIDPENDTTPFVITCGLNASF